MADEKIIIFGMGKIFQRRMDRFDFSKVKAVTDNQVLHNEEGYSGLNIICPQEIRTLEFDYIVICAGYRAAKEIYVQLTELFGVPEEKIISDKEYFKEISWEPRTLLEICRKLKISSIINSKKYFYSYGILSNTNVMGEDFGCISWERDKNEKAILLGKVQDEATLAALVDKFEAGTYPYKSDFKYMFVLVNPHGHLDLKAKAREGYLVHYIKGLDLKLVVFEKKRTASIYVATHKEYDAPSLNIYTTLWLGKEKSNNISYVSEVGDNISYLNLKINECTGLYWMWKHAKEEIVGLNHYRRFFKLSGSEGILSDQEVSLLFGRYDIIVGNATCTYPVSNSRYMENSMDAKAFSKAKQLIQDAIIKWQPDYAECFREVMEGHAFFPCNMFITSKKIFDRYCEWLFSIIIPSAEDFDETPYDDYSKRAIGFFAERLLTVWLYMQDYDIKELPVLFRDTELECKAAVK